MKRERCLGGVMVSIAAMTMPVLAACCGTTGTDDSPPGYPPLTVKIEPVHNEQEFLAAVKAIALELEWSDYEIDESAVFCEAGDWRTKVTLLPRRPGGTRLIVVSADGSVTLVPL